MATSVIDRNGNQDYSRNDTSGDWPSHNQAHGIKAFAGRHTIEAMPPSILPDSGLVPSGTLLPLQNPERHFKPMNDNRFPAHDNQPTTPEISSGLTPSKLLARWRNCIHNGLAKTQDNNQ